MDTSFDALIVGAGPAGLCAALRLRQFGYRVMLVERSPVWPREHIGEALTPGVQNIVSLLDANDALSSVPHLARRPACMLWRRRSVDIVAGNGSAMVGRAGFDAALLALAQERGVEVIRPAAIETVRGSPGDWRIALGCGAAGTRHVDARYLVDASGRRNHSVGRLDCAPRLAALWIDIPQEGLPADMLDAARTEALEHGWLWGSSLPGARYRLMLVFDPGDCRGPERPAPCTRLRMACAGSVLFASCAGHALDGVIRQCVATPYVAPDSWQDGRANIGDAAFALDPISSSGVEKAMRFALQVAVAIHTLLGDGTPGTAALCREFFMHRLVETCARHAHWTAVSYGQAWCADQPFWQRRTAIQFGGPEPTLWPALQARLYAETGRLERFAAPVLRPLAALETARTVRLADGASVVALPCVMADRVQSHRALAHPHLERPVAFLASQALFPHLDHLVIPQTLDGVLARFRTSMPDHAARSITAWLWQHGLLAHAS